MSRDDWYLAICTAVILAVVVPWTRFQNHAHWQSVAWVPFVSPEVSAADVVANILLYMPWGFAFVRRFRSGGATWKAVALAAAVSVKTEGCQIFSHGRIPSMSDVSSNVIGAWAGAIWGTYGALPRRR